MCPKRQKSFPKRWHRTNFGCKWMSGYTEGNFVFHLLREVLNKNWRSIYKLHTVLLPTTLSFGKIRNSWHFPAEIIHPRQFHVPDFDVSGNLVWEQNSEFRQRVLFICSRKLFSDVYESWYAKKVQTKEQKALMINMY